MTVQPRRITAKAFARYGETAVLPDDEEPLASEEAFSYWSDVSRLKIDGETEIGYCTAFQQEKGEAPWLERHLRTPELLIPIDAPFLLPVLLENESEEQMEVFEVRPGEAVIIDRGVWHGACSPACSDEVTYFVIFRRGTPHEDVIKRDLVNVKISV